MDVKGVILLNTLEYIKISFGSSKLKKVIKRLSAEERKMLQMKIATMMWYPFDLYLHLTYAIIDEFFEGDINKAKILGEFVAVKGADSQYKGLIKPGTAEYVVSRAEQVQETYFSEGKMLTEIAEEGSMLLKLVNHPKIDPIHLIRLTGWMEKALELSGCEDVKVVYEIKEENGAKVVYFKGSWK